MSEHDHWEELAAGHALNALEPEEEHDFLRHLRGCDLCPRTLAEMHTIGAELAHAVEPTEAPPGLRASIMDALQREARPGRPSAPVGDLGSRRRRRADARTLTGLRRSGAGSWLTSAASLILVIVLALWNATLRSEVRTQDQALALRGQLLELVTSPGTTVIPLGQPGGTANGSAVLHDRRVMLVVSGLVPTSGRHAYVLWVRGRDATTMVAVEAFAIANPGRPNLIPEMELPAGVGVVVELAVSQELLADGDELPAAPSGTPFLRGPLV